MATPWRIGAALTLALLLVGAQTVAAQGTATFSNSAPILIPGNQAATALAAADVYPSDIAVTGMTGVVSDVNVTIRGLSHTWGQDVDMMLVAPDGTTNLVFLSDVAGTGGGANPLANRTFTFDDAGGAAIAAATVATSGVYRPSNPTPATTDGFLAPAPAQSSAAALSVFNGLSPNGTWSLYIIDDTSGDVGRLTGGWSIEITTAASAPATTATFAVSPSGANFAAAGVCSLPGIRRIATLGMTNSGTSGTVNVLSATLGGSTAFTIEALSPVPPTFPVALAPAAVTNIGVAFSPTAGQSGPQNATLTFTYNIDGGPTQTRAIPLSGQGDSEGAGWVFRSSVADPACSNGADAPGTAFINPVAAGHTRVTTYATGTGDDGRFNITLNTAYPTTFPSFRMFGVNHTNFQILTNGIFAVGTANLGATATGTSFTAGTAVVGVAAMNLTFLGVAADNAGVAGEPGIFYGTTDVDTDGDQELVITWWHAYDAGSVPGATGQYLTAQAILFQAAAPTGEDYFELRYPDGNDANGVPYRQNTATVPAGDTDNSMENDAVVNIIDPTGQEQALYRLRNGTANLPATPVFGGPLYVTTGGPIGVRFQAETQATIQGQAGWRMLGVPIRTLFLNRLAQLNLIQGVAGGTTGGTTAQTFPGQYPTYAPNIYTSYSGTGYVAPTSTADIIVPGQGLIWYFYNQTFDPGDPDGTSNSYAFPQPLQGVGAEPLLDAGSGSNGTTVHANGNGWNLLANPYRDDINITDIASWTRGGTLASIVAQVWDPNAGGSGSYVLSSAQGNLISSWQGFMIQNNTTGGAVALNIPTPRTEGAPFLGRTAPPRMVAFELSSRAADTGTALVDRSAMLYLAEEGTAGWDLLDAGKLTPLAASYATIAFQGERNGNAVLKAQESRPLDSAFEVPMAVSAVGTAPELTLSWAPFDNVPADWRVTLRDLLTGAEIDLRAQSSYTFSVAPARALELVSGMPPVGAAEARLADTRFVLVVSGATTGNEGGTSLPTAFALHTVAPNPIVGVSAALSYDLPESAATRIEVYDMLGRRVATVVDGTVEAGRHTARLDASALASGSYVVRMTAGSFVQAQRVTVTR